MGAMRLIVGTNSARTPYTPTIRPSAIPNPSSSSSSSSSSSFLRLDVVHPPQPFGILTLLRLYTPAKPRQQSSHHLNTVPQTHWSIMEAVQERLSNPALSLPIAVLVVYLIYKGLTAKSPIPQGLPWIGRDPKKLFSEKRAALSSFNNVRQWLNQGYEKVPSMEMGNRY